VIADKLLVHRTLVGLLLAGWIRPVTDIPEDDAGRFAGEDAQSTSLVELVERMDGMSYYEFLGIPSGASQAEIKKRCDELRAFYLQEKASAEFKFYRRKILIKLDETFAILGDADRRKNYDELLTHRPTDPSTHDMVERRELQKKIAKTNYEAAKDLLEHHEDTFGAIQLLQQAVIFDPENADYFWLLGSCQMKNPKWMKDAVDTFQKVVMIDPSRSEAWIEMGKVYIKNRMFRRAINCFTEALKYEKESEEAKSGLKAAKKGEDAERKR